MRWINDKSAINFGKVLKTDNWMANESAMPIFWMSSPKDASCVQNTMNVLFQINVFNWTTTNLPGLKLLILRAPLWIVFTAKNIYQVYTKKIELEFPFLRFRKDLGATRIAKNIFLRQYYTQLKSLVIRICFQISTSVLWSLSNHTHSSNTLSVELRHMRSAMYCASFSENNQIFAHSSRFQHRHQKGFGHNVIPTFNCTWQS